MDVNTGAAAPRPSSQGTMEDPDTQQDHQVIQSAILYLLQEATKLATVHGACFDSTSTTGLGERSKPGPSYLVSHGPPQYNISHACLYNQPKDESEAEQRWSHTSSALPSSCSRSPWEVMSLINQQCERLLHSGDPEEGGSTTTSVSGDSAQGPGCSGGPVNETFLVRHVGDKDRPCCRSRGAIGESGGGCSRSGGPSVSPEQWRSQDSTTDGASDVNGNSKAVPATKNSEPLEKHAGAAMRISSNRLCVKEERRKNSVLVEVNTLKEPCSETKGELTFKHIPCASDHIFRPLSEHLAFKSGQIEDGISVPPSMDAMAYLTPDPELKLDLNANICLTFDPLKDTQQKPPRAASLRFRSSLILSSETINSTNVNVTTLKQDVSLTTSRPELLRSCSGVEGSAPPAPQCPPGAAWRTRTPRKQPNPSRSADLSGPDFQGVAFRMYPELDDSREQCRLVITSKYSEGLSKSGRKPRVRSRSCKSSLRTTCSDQEINVTSLSKSKVCASCCTKKTPMWRDAEDGTPLCNACGIRYKKYRLRCVQCWHIPRKERNSNSKCFRCGGYLRLALCLRKNTASLGNPTTPLNDA